MPRKESVHVSLVALPECTISTLYGLYDVLNASSLESVGASAASPFRAEVVGERSGSMMLASSVAVNVGRTVDEVDETGIIIVPSIVLPRHGWVKGRYPALIRWIRAMHDKGTTIVSACSGIFLLAETELFDGRDATVHFGYAAAFASSYPAVSIHPERVLVISGANEELVSSGASTSWHDLVLYLIARYSGATVAQEIARTFALQWHQSGLAPYIVFQGNTDHGDAEIAAAQAWLSNHFSVAKPVEEMVKRSRLAPRTFKRRFASATGLAPIAYVQRLRIEDAKRRLERTDTPVDEISWRVGYEDPAFFRRLFRRTTGVAPGAYRKRFRVPDFGRS